MEKKHVNAADFIPQRPPMAMVDRILLDRLPGKVVSAVIRPGNRFLNGDGVLDRTSIPEFVAQAAAAVNTYENGGICRPGMLALGRKIEFFCDIKVNDEITITARDENPIGDWFVLTFEVKCVNTGELCARGEISVCLF